MVSGLNLDIQETSTAVKPWPPAMVVVMVWLMPPTRSRPTRPHSSAGQHHRTDDDLFYFDAHVFRGIFTLAHNRNGIALFAVIQVNIHKYGDDAQPQKCSSRYLEPNSLGQPARVRILVDDADLTGALGHLPQDGDKKPPAGLQCSSSSGWTASRWCSILP